jgi:hypothetical protein
MAWVHRRVSHTPPPFFFQPKGLFVDVLNISTRYKDKVKDYNFGSLIRMDAKGEYGEANTIFGACELCKIANIFLGSLVDLF